MVIGSECEPTPGAVRAWRVIALVLAVVMMVFAHWPPRWLGAIPLFHVSVDLPRQAGGFALLTVCVALARPLGLRRPWHAQWSTATLITAGLALGMEWTLPLTPGGAWPDPAAVVRRLTGVVLALAAGEAAAPSGQRDAATAWAWRTILLILGPPAVAMAMLPSFASRLMFMVPVIPEVDVRADRLAHFMGALLLTVTLMQARILGVPRVIAGQTLAAALMLLAGPVVEIVQGMIGRGQDIVDCLFHELGVLIAVALVAAADPLLQWTRRRRATPPAPSPPGSQHPTAPVRRRSRSRTRSS